MICDGCQREVTRATFVKDGERALYFCVRCKSPHRTYPLGVGVNKNGYTVSPAYYDDITSRRGVYENGERHVETGHRNKTHFVMVSSRV